MYDKFDNQSFHDNPPTFKASDRKRYFYIDEKFGHTLLAKVRGDDNKVFLTVAYGYFRATGQFFDTAIQADIDYVASKFKLTGSFAWSEYRPNTRDRHRQSIRDLLGYSLFDIRKLDGLQTLIRNSSRSQKSPARCFEDVNRWLFGHKIETPNFSTLTKTIDDLYNNHLNDQIKKVTHLLGQDDKHALDQLLEKPEDANDQWQPHRVTLLKKFNQSIRAMKVKENIESFDLLQPLYNFTKPVIDQLDFTQDGLKRFASQVQKKQIFQVKRLKDPQRYLLLSAFIVHQFRQLEDTLTETFLAATTSVRNEADRKAKEEYFLQRNTQTEHTQLLVKDTQNLVKVVSDLRETLENPMLDDCEKVTQSKKIIAAESISEGEISIHVDDVQEDLNKVSGQALTMKHYEEASLKLQRKCNDILLRLELSCDASGEVLNKAIQRFKQTKGQIDNKFPIDFMTKSEQAFVKNDNVINKPLYKVLLFIYIADAIKRDSLSVIDSYRYRKLDKYLISPERWAADRAYLLAQAKMEDFSDAQKVLDDLELQLDAQYKETNEHLKENKNEYIEADGAGGYRLTSERNTSAATFALDEKLDIELLPEDMQISIVEAMHTVNQATNFLDEFEHIDHRYLKDRPENRNFYACIIGLGAHIGTKKIAKNSPAIKRSTLESTSTAYFSLDNAQRASDAIIRFVNKLPLSQLYRSEYGMQTSSDGQKWTVSKDSFNANHSFKYGGKDMVVSEYSFIDARGLFPHSTVISGSEREAHYMIDGLLRNETVKSDMHSTDTHGYTEAVFGMTYLLKFSFAPRIKNVHRQQLYSGKYPSVYKQKDYLILPAKRFDRKLLEKHWEDILRLVASIKLGEVSASQIFKRLNSYSADENSLYSALKEFGRIPKSLYILRYVDDVDLRAAVHKQLNKGESGNRLNKALAIGRLEYSQTLKDDQELAECCKRILKNVVVCWNFMYVSQLLMRAKTDAERTAILKKVKTSSLLAWEHFIFHGEFDFSDAKLQDSQKFDFKGMVNPSLIKGIDDEEFPTT